MSELTVNAIKDADGNATDFLSLGIAKSGASSSFRINNRDNDDTSVASSITLMEIAG